MEGTPILTKELIMENTTFETTEFDAIMAEDEEPTITTDSFGKEIAKTLVVSAVATAGTVLGFAAIGLVINKVEARKAARLAKKAGKFAVVQNEESNTTSEK
jgi:hypothetical protein